MMATFSVSGFFSIAGSGKVSPFYTHIRSESFKGLNDLVIASNGDIYFTDQGQTGMQDPRAASIASPRRPPGAPIDTARAPTASR
jgi:sugar lactone lactonase YvrE